MENKNKNIIIAGHWEIGYMTPIQEQYYWSFLLNEFGITNWLMNPVSGIANTEPTVNLKEFKDYKEMLSLNEDLPRVFLEPRTSHQNPDTIWLHDFTHPEECIYVFGSAHYNPTIFFKRPQDVIVTIKTDIDRGNLWSNQALAIVLYDRMVKLWH